MMVHQTKKLGLLIPLVLFSMLGGSVPIYRAGPPSPQVTIHHYQQALQVYEQIVCLARVIYFEARNQPIAGQYAVGMVVLNRRDSSAYPDNICAVAHQSKMQRHTRSKYFYQPVKHLCQFSYYCDGLPDTITEPEVYLAIYQLAVELYTKNVYDITNGATHYHANYVNPYWAKSLTKIVTIGNHIFYR